MSGTNRLGITAGVFGSLALAVSASADFTGCQVELQGTYNTASAFGGPDVGLVDVWNVYALFSHPLDQYIETFVDATDPNFDKLVLSSDVNDAFDGLGGGFWNWAFGTNTPLPNGVIYGLDPAAAGADTYLTIRLEAGFPNEPTDPGADEAFFSSGSEAILNASGLLSTGGVINVDFEYRALPIEPQTFPIDGRVLFLQVAVLSGEHASGVWNLEWVNVTLGTGGRARCEWTTVPGACGPGAGLCGEPNGTPGCEDPACCAAVCDLDPICCIIEWDQSCADIAIDIGCAVGCPPGGPPPSGCIPAPAGLISWWPGDGNANDIQDDNDGTLLGGAGFAPGQLELAFDFDGVATSGVTVPNAPSLNFGTGADFSIDAWILAPSGASGIRVIVDKRDAPGGPSAVGYVLFLFNGRLGFQLADAPLEPNKFSTFISPSPDLRDGTFHHVAVTVDRDSSTGGRLYVDGCVVLIFDPTLEPGDLSNNEPLLIGKHQTPGFPGAYLGQIDEVEIFDRALLASEINDIFLATNCGKCKDELLLDDLRNLVIALGLTCQNPLLATLMSGGPSLGGFISVVTARTPGCITQADAAALIAAAQAIIAALDCPSLPCDVVLDPLSCSDLNGDGVVDCFDLLLLLVAFGPCGVGDCPADCDSDGDVGFTDMLFLLANWTGGPPPTGVQACVDQFGSDNDLVAFIACVEAFCCP